MIWNRQPGGESPITTAAVTGIKAVDLLAPIGRGGSAC